MNVVIVGSGIAGVTFAEKYRALSPDAEIVLVTGEHDGYYSRPLLSRGFTKNDIEQSIILKSFDKLRENNIDVIAGSEVTAIDRSAKTVAIEGPGQEKSLSYDKLILAQGSAAFVPPPLRAYEKLFFSLNSLIDLKAMRKFRQPFLNQNIKPHWAIVGGGLIGCEVASDLAVAGDKVTVFHAMDRLMERQLLAEDSVSLLYVLQASGVEVLLNQSVHSFVEEGGKLCVKTDVTAEFDALLVACGFKPRTELAQHAGLDVARGIKVNPYLQTKDEAIFALGDVAELPDGKLYAYILPIRSQALWLANYLAGQEQAAWSPAPFTTKAKVHGFEAAHPYNL
ncbi:NAD(P)/FAD-dependent oxidoreductase [Methyloglobulus sp.]|uniref:NAD(P)/FAD-dependent oxidoreductase n=1 Tax=Methyloglobulus sp. TaxID=2518622 RepID=UPI00398A0922